MTLDREYLRYIATVRRYSLRTRDIYAGILDSFAAFACGDDPSDEALLSALTPRVIRGYEVHLLDEQGLSARTVGQHLSVLSGFSRFLMRQGRLPTNPVRLVSRPKVARRLPQVFRQETVADYLARTACYATPEGLGAIIGEDKTSREVWTACRDRLVIHILYDTGMRRSELIGMTVGRFDAARGVFHVLGKGGKMREIPVPVTLSEEISLYLQATSVVTGRTPAAGDPLLTTEKGLPLYPVAVDRILKRAFAGVTGHKSPHVLRHTLATGLLDGGADLNSIKELLGHSSLAATQVYTHNSVEKLRQTYLQAHPRASRDPLDTLKQ